MTRSKSVPLARAIQQTQSFANVEHEVYLSILQAASQLTHWTDQVLKPHGITQAQYNVLRILRGAGDLGLSRNEIAGRLVTATPDVTRLLDRMEKAGWLRRDRSREDRRQVSTFLLPAGARLLKALDSPILDLHRRQFKGLKKESLHALLRTLEEVRANVM